MSLQEILIACARMAAGEGAGAGALASVARRRGSLPMSSTAKMLVGADGARIGTVGGGCLEAEITERAFDVIERRLPATSEHTLNSEMAGDYGLTCGGTAVMFLEPVFTHPDLQAVYEAVAAIVTHGGRGALVTALDWNNGPGKALLRGEAISGSSDATLHALLRSFDVDRGDQRLDNDHFLELVAGAPRLIVFGGGHVGAAVAQTAAFAGWSVTVVDDRAEYADPQRFPFADATMVCEYHDIPAALQLDSATYVVVATRGHQHDALVVEQLAGRKLRYVGMLGSRRKVALTWKLLGEQGIAAEDLDRIKAPVGLSIGADTPQEIAVSIVAEMITVRREGSRRRGGFELSSSSAGAAPAEAKE